MPWKYLCVNESDSILVFDSNFTIFAGYIVPCEKPKAWDVECRWRMRWTQPLTETFDRKVPIFEKLKAPIMPRLRNDRSYKDCQLKQFKKKKRIYDLYKNFNGTIDIGLF